MRIYYFGPGGYPPPGWDPGLFPPPWQLPGPPLPPPPSGLPPGAPYPGIPPAPPVIPDPWIPPPITPGPGIDPDPGTPTLLGDAPPPTDPPSGLWFQCLDDTFWEPLYYMFWLVDHWYSKKTFAAAIKALVNWPISYRPSQIRIEYTGSVSVISIRDSANHYIGIDYGPHSLEAIDLDFTKYSTDIYSIYFTTSTLITVTNIEFLY